MKWIKDRMGATDRRDELLAKEWTSEEWENLEEVEVHEGHDVVSIYRPTLTTYSLRILAPAIPYEEKEHVHTESASDKRVLADLPAMTEMVEEALEGMLPEGYSVRITEWDK